MFHPVHSSVFYSLLDTAARTLRIDGSRRTGHQRYTNYAYYYHSWYSRHQTDTEMTRIGLLSDTHSYLDPRIFEYFRDVDEIWHAGDIGDAGVLQKLRTFKPTRAVYGNMDSGDVRYSLDEFYRFRVEDVNVLMTHIGGYPGRYNPWLIPMFRKAAEAKAASTSHASPEEGTPDQGKQDQLVPNQGKQDQASSYQHDIIDLFVCGHSHILKVMYDKTWGFLTMNPGAAGKQGWQTVQTLLRFTIDGKEIRDLEVIELSKK